MPSRKRKREKQDIRHQNHHRRNSHSHRPDYIEVGDYVRTKPLPTAIVCKAYTAPPSSVAYPGSGLSISGGEFITSFSPDTYLGPITAIEITRDFVTVQLHGDHWVNIWRYDPLFACEDCGAPMGMCFCPSEYASAFVGVWYARKVDASEVKGWVLRGWQHVF